jgi:hypothetical protein
MPNDNNTPTAQSVTSEEFSQRVVDAMIEVLRASTTPEILRAQQILLQRLALTGAVVPSRINPPQNITEIGGYLNLLRDTNQTDLFQQVLASILGVAGSNSLTSLEPVAPPLAFVRRTNDRPEGSQRATFPLEFTIRSDFAPAFDRALTAIHDRGCQVPILTPFRSLPQATAGDPPATELIRFLGRTFDFVLTAALIDPDADPMALAHPGDPGAAEAYQVVARQLSNTAPLAAEVVLQRWTAWQCDANACQESTADRTFLPLTPILNDAGWFQPSPPTDPISRANPGTWARWVNITGLVAGVTRFGDELTMLFPQAEIAASSLRDQLQFVWNGTDFVSP